MRARTHANTISAHAGACGDVCGVRQLDVQGDRIVTHQALACSSASLARNENLSLLLLLDPHLVHLGRRRAVSWLYTVACVTVYTVHCDIGYD